MTRKQLGALAIWGGLCACMVVPIVLIAGSKAGTSSRKFSQAPVPERQRIEVLLIAATAELDENDRMTIEGMVENMSGESLRHVQVVAEIYDENDVFVTFDRGFVEYNPLMNWQKSPFRLTAGPNPRMLKYRLRFLRADGRELAMFDRREKK